MNRHVQSARVRWRYGRGEARVLFHVPQSLQDWCMPRSGALIGIPTGGVMGSTTAEASSSGACQTRRLGHTDSGLFSAYSFRAVTIADVAYRLLNNAP